MQYDRHTHWWTGEEREYRAGAKSVAARTFDDDAVFDFPSVPCGSTHEYGGVIRTATHCSTLQHTATRCNTLQHASTCCTTLQHTFHAHGGVICTATHCNTLQHTATRCNTLQHTATQFNRLQHTATHCNILQHAVTHCNALQHTATRCITLQHIRNGPKCAKRRGENWGRIMAMKPVWDIEKTIQIQYGLIYLCMYFPKNPRPPFPPPRRPHPWNTHYQFLISLISSTLKHNGLRVPREMGQDFIFSRKKNSNVGRICPANLLGKV